MDYATLASGVRRDDWRRENPSWTIGLEKSSHFGGNKKPSGSPCQPDRSARLYPAWEAAMVNNGKSSSFKLFFNRSTLGSDSPIAGH
jgi:hypothetical protein